MAVTKKFRTSLTTVSQPAESERFVPAWWCHGPYLQTCWQTLARRCPKVALKRERLELPDGDFLDLDWTAAITRGPLVIILHGLAGSVESKYVLGILEALAKHGYRGVALNFRGCSGEPNRLTRGYHAGETQDLAYVIKTLRAREPHTPIAVIGFSLGGNALLKWLGETRQNTISAAVAVSIPFVLAECAKRLDRGFSRVFQWYLLAQLRNKLKAKSKLMSLPLGKDLSLVRTLRDFDEHVTAPLHGFAGADDFYNRSSSRQYLRHITVPTLILQSRDDPFLTEAGIPDTNDISSAIHLELQDRGGHVGFVTGPWPWRARYWLEERIPIFLKEYLEPDEEPAGRKCRSTVR